MQWFAAMILCKKGNITSVHVNQHIIILTKAPCPKIKRPPLRSLNIFELNNWALVLQKTRIPNCKRLLMVPKPSQPLHNKFTVSLSSQKFTAPFEKQHPFPLCFFFTSGCPLRDLTHEAQQMAHQGAFPGRSVRWRRVAGSLATPNSQKKGGSWSKLGVWYFCKFWEWNM